MNTSYYVPYFTTSRYRVQAMITLSGVKPGEKMADLGSGDGRIVLAFAQKGAEAVGFELSEQFTAQSELLLRENGVATHAFIQRKDFWQVDLSSFDIICVYPMPDVMEKLEQKLQTELQSGSRVLLNFYPFPTWQDVAYKDHIYLYQK